MKPIICVRSRGVPLAAAALLSRPSSSLTFTSVVNFSPVSPLFYLLSNILLCPCHLERILRGSCQFFGSRCLFKFYFEYSGLVYPSLPFTASIPRPPRAPFLYFLIYFLLLLAPLCHWQVSPVCSSLSSLPPPPTPPPTPSSSPTSFCFFYTPCSLSISLSILRLLWLVPLWHTVSCP